MTKFYSRARGWCLVFRRAGVGAFVACMIVGGIGGGECHADPGALVEDVRQATDDEIANQHPQNDDGFGMDLADDDDLDELDLSGTGQRDQGPRTLH